MSEIDLSIVVVSWNTREMVLRCLERIDSELRSDCEEITTEVWLVDNGSEDGTVEAVADGYPWVKQIGLEENTGYARGNNAALSRATGRVVLMLNSDVLIERAPVLRCLEVLLAHADAAAVGPHLVHADGRAQNTMHAFPSFWTELLPSLWLELIAPGRFPSKRRPPSAPRAVDAVRGAALFVKREALLEIGPLAEEYFFFLEETDWCLRARKAGWRVFFVPDARLTHLLGGSSKRVAALATRIEYHRSLHHFLRVHRGAPTAHAVRILRVSRSLGSMLLLALAAPASRDARRRFVERFGLVRWHLQGCPDQAGLAGMSASTAASGGKTPRPSPASASSGAKAARALDGAAQTREDSSPEGTRTARGDA